MRRVKDRNVQYPYRFHVRPVPGTDDICEIIPAPGTVYEDGTFWNKQNVLKDATAALYGKTAAAVPDEIFAAIRTLIQSAQSTAERNNAKFAMGSYAGTGTKEITLNLPFDWKLLIVGLVCVNVESANHVVIATKNPLSAVGLRYYGLATTISILSPTSVSMGSYSSGTNWINHINSKYYYAVFG